MKFLIISLGFLCLSGFIIILVLAFMVVFGLYCFFIKRVRLSFRVAEELQARAAQQLSRDERETKGQSAAFETKRRLLSFKKSMIVWPKEYKIIFFITVAFVLFRVALSMAIHLGWKSSVTHFIMLLNYIFWGAVVLLPLLWVGFIILTGKLKKTIQKLEEAIAQQDEAVSLQNTIGGKNDQ